MAWWGDDFNPDFNADSVQNDLDIVNEGIVNISGRMDGDTQLEADHKTVWDYWNPMCGYLDDYLTQATGYLMDYGPLVDSNVTEMALGNHDDVIYQIEDPNPNGGEYYRALYPNKRYLYGPSSPEGPIETQTDTSESYWIDYEQTWAIDEGALGDPQDNSDKREQAQNGQIASIDLKRAALASLVSDLSDGVAQYPGLQGLIDLCGEIDTRCLTARAAAAAEISAGSPETSVARENFLDARESEITADIASFRIQEEPVRAQRYMWTDLRCNISRGTYGNIQANIDALARLNLEKIRLEALIEQYEAF